MNVTPLQKYCSQNLAKDKAKLIRDGTKLQASIENHPAELVTKQAKLEELRAAVGALEQLEREMRH